MKQPRMQTVDGNQAAASMAYLLNEVISIYPITPASPMGELSDEWASLGKTNLWGSVPHVVEMQSEGGAAGAIHGALQLGALTTTFTASQGLLLMIPNMYKIAGELTPTVFHVASRSIASQALSIFGDHSDVMTARMTGFGFLCANSAQEVQDFAVIAQMVSLQSRVPMLHFFDGFRTSHEVQKINTVDESILRQLMDEEWIQQFRARALSPDRPVLRGSSQNPDVYFQARETVNPYYEKLPDIMQQSMDRFAELTGRAYGLFEYHGNPQAERVIILMGSGAETAEETVDYLLGQGESVGLVKVRLYRPFSPRHLIQAIPESCRKIAVLDRTKEPGADGEPLYKDVITALVQHYYDAQPTQSLPRIVGGRYGLSSKEFRPTMVVSIFEELKKEHPKNYFTMGIIDDVTHSSLPWDETLITEANSRNYQAVFYGLGSDGTVSANKNSIKLIGAETDLQVQGYFVYDSKKSGAVTISHLRFGPEPIHSTYLIEDGQADFVACHQHVFLERYNMLDKAADNSVFLINSALNDDLLWQSFPHKMQQQIIDKKIRVFHIDAYAVADACSMGKRINTIMQSCFFAISEILPVEQAISGIKRAVEQSYAKKGKGLVALNFKAIDEALSHLHELTVPDVVSSEFEVQMIHLEKAPAFVQQVTAEMIAGHGDQIPVSLLPADGTFPVGTSSYEKRNLADEIPVLDQELCTQCGKCPLVCPHSAIRSKIFPQSALADAPSSFKYKPTIGKGFPEGMMMTYQVAPEDCTGCGLCVDICPIRSKENPEHKALNMAPQPPLRQQEKINWNYFLSLPEYDRRELKIDTIKGAMVLQPLFEFSSACMGCGETPYIKLVTQLFGDRMVVANATGCSSIFGGNLPTTPWTCNADGRGPAWNNSLFEDSAEFGMGMRVAIDQHKQQAEELLVKLKGQLDAQLVENILSAQQEDEAGLFDQRQRVEQLQQSLKSIDSPEARHLSQLAENLCRKSVWIIGGDGWAYDIGYGGLDHVLANGRDVNILVLDTEVYSNTGGQTSKATPRGAIAKFSAAGKATAKKELGLLAMDYENVYVAHIAYGAKDVQTLRALLEAEAHHGPSIVIAYAPCISHGVDMANNHQHQQMAVNSGHWPLFRFDPKKIQQGENPLKLDSVEPSISYREFMETEPRFSMLWKTHPDLAEQTLAQAQQEVNHRYHFYRQLAELDWDDDTSVAGSRMKFDKRTPAKRNN